MTFQSSLNSLNEFEVSPNCPCLAQLTASFRSPVLMTRALAARVWLAPSLHHVMVKMRLSNGRLTGEALLDSIRVDETVAQQ